MAWFEAGTGRWEPADPWANDSWGLAETVSAVPVAFPVSWLLLAIAGVDRMGKAGL